jgi:hypothetical protein
MSPAMQSAAGHVNDPYQRLAELAETERDHAVAGRIAELRAVQGEAAALVSTLPAKAPEAARPHLERAAALRAEITAALAAAMRAARADAVRVEQGRVAVAAYRPAPGPVAPAVARRG